MTQGLVCAFSTLEPWVFTVAGNRETKRLEVVRRPRQCLHFYWYLIDPEFGRVGGDVATPAPHRPERADFPHSVLQERASLTAA